MLLKKSTAGYWALIVFALGLLHRAAQLWLVAGVVSRQVALNSPWQSMQYLPADLLERNFSAALLYLQQTPPLPHLVAWLTYTTSNDAVSNAIVLIAFAGILSCTAGALLVLLLAKMRIPPPLACMVALLFLGNSGVVLLEYTAFGQCFYEQMTMVGSLIAALAAVSLLERRSLAMAFWLGIAVAALALTRATFSYFLIVAVAWLVWCRISPRYLLAFALPIALLHGGWAAKQYWTQGQWSWATSSWGGANMQAGDIKRQDRGFANWAADPVTSCTQRWSHVFDPAMPAFLSYAKYARDLDTLLAENANLGPSAAARAVDSTAYRARGQWLPTDSAGFRELSACIQQMYLDYWLHNPENALRGWATSYAFFWRPMESYTSAIPTMLVASRADRLPGGPVGINKLLSSYLQPATYFARQEKMPWHLGADKALLVPVNVVVIPFAPQLATLLAIAALHSLPIIALYIRIKEKSLKDAFPAGFSFLLLLFIYMAGVCNLVEYGENMRFRLPVEPIIWSIGLVTAHALLGRLWPGRFGVRPPR